MQNTQQLSYMMNTVIFILVLIMMGVYYAIGATSLVYYSIFVSAVYIFNYALIKKSKLIEVTWIIYAMITVYMFICTIFLGYEYGFPLYAMSTIPLIYHIQYLAQKDGSRDPKPNLWSALIVISCLTSSLYSVIKGPVYHIEGVPTITFLALNISSVCFFLIFFSQQTIKLIIKSERSLKHQANYDALTGLANRYNMVAHLKQAMEAYGQASQISLDAPSTVWAAMLDIDDFKKINDQYGHATGDRVLEKLAEIMKRVCTDCKIGRWGGEEFLICGNTSKISTSVLFDLLKEVERSPVQSPHGSIYFTISVGVSNLRPSDSIDSWIVKADKKLYQAKGLGKNQVIL